MLSLFLYFSCQLGSFHAEHRMQGMAVNMVGEQCLDKIQSLDEINNCSSEAVQCELNTELEQLDSHLCCAIESKYPSKKYQYAEKIKKLCGQL